VRERQQQQQQRWETGGSGWGSGQAAADYAEHCRTQNRQLLLTVGALQQRGT
jgi:hypothetical protein